MFSFSLSGKHKVTLGWSPLCGVLVHSAHHEGLLQSMLEWAFPIPGWMAPPAGRTTGSSLAAPETRLPGSLPCLCPNFRKAWDTLSWTFTRYMNSKKFPVINPCYLPFWLSDSVTLLPDHPPVALALRTPNRCFIIYEDSAGMSPTLKGVCLGRLPWLHTCLNKPGAGWVSHRPFTSRDHMSPNCLDSQTLSKQNSSSVNRVQNGRTFGEHCKQFLYRPSYGTEDMDARETSAPWRIINEHPTLTLRGRAEPFHPYSIKCWTSSPFILYAECPLFLFIFSLFCYCENRFFPHIRPDQFLHLHPTFPFPRSTPCPLLLQKRDGQAKQDKKGCYKAKALISRLQKATQ